VQATQGSCTASCWRCLPRCYPGTRKVVGATGFEPAFAKATAAKPATPCAQGRSTPGHAHGGLPGRQPKRTLYLAWLKAARAPASRRCSRERRRSDGCHPQTGIGPGLAENQRDPRCNARLRDVGQPQAAGLPTMAVVSALASNGRVVIPSCVGNGAPTPARPTLKVAPPAVGRLDPLPWMRQEAVELSSRGPEA